MSRFAGKVYREVLQEPTKRYRLSSKEKRLWKIPTPWKSLGKLLLAIILFVGVFGLLVELSGESTLLMHVLIWSWLILSLALVVRAGVAAEKKRKAELRKRRPENLQQFAEKAPLLRRYKKNYLRAIRHTLGFTYGLNPDIVYAADTAGSLSAIVRRRGGSPPLGFEVVLGTANRLGIELQDQDVDRIGAQIYKTAPNVEGLMTILAEELSLAADQPAEVAGICAARSGSPSSESDSASKRIKAKVIAKCKFLGLCALMGAGIVLDAEMERGTDPLSKEMGTAVLKGLGTGLLVGIGLYLVAFIWKKKFPGKPKGKGSKENEIDLEELKDLADKSPARKYVGLSILELARQIGSERTFTESKPLPSLADMGPDEAPSFTEVLLRIRKMAGLGLAFWQTPRRAVFPITLGAGAQRPQQFDVHVELCDGADEAYVTLAVQPHKADTAQTKP
ncbi:MAG: hypothetical protein ACYTEL_11760 [Planctomycetota bacterium]|jgi:hypothetical protein